MTRKIRLLPFVLILALAAGCSASMNADSPSTMDMPALDTPAPADYAVPPPADYAVPPPAEYAVPPPAEYAFEPDSEDWRYAPFDETEEYLTAPDSPFKDVKTSPLSTFSADVDTASYSSLRRFITQGQEPQGIRVEELINYFDYNYPEPDGEHPFSITAEVGVCPWAPSHLLAMIGIQGARLIDAREINNNIVFLIDVSGSMNDPNKLPLVKQSMKMLLEQLGQGDVISIVTYAGSDRIVADSVSGADRRKLNQLIDNLSAGGSTAGAKGIQTAYELAAKNFIVDGNNRVILATDGDFNVGMSSVADLTSLIESERERGVFISVLGYGMGNLKDDMMKSIAMNGNGNYAYIDTIQEAQKVLVNEFDATMLTIAKDVKLQAEFNPETVESYRLIGYNTRRLENEDFNNDLKDAGDIGAGHNVTAFYELIPAGSEQNDMAVDPLTYSSQITTGSDDFLTVKVRYKQPDGFDSQLTERRVGPEAFGQRESENFLFASAVAEFGLLVTRSEYRGDSSQSSVLRRAGQGLGSDAFGLRREFLELVKQYGRIVD